MPIEATILLPNTNDGAFSTMVYPDFVFNFNFNFNIDTLKVLQIELKLLILNLKLKLNKNYYLMDAIFFNLFWIW